MSHCLNCLKENIKGIIEGNIIGLIKGDTRSLDSGSYEPQSMLLVSPLIAAIVVPYRTLSQPL